MERVEATAGLEQEAWHNISNPVAQQVVREVFQHLSAGALDRYSWTKYPADPFQQRVRHELERSSLAQRIPAGTAEVPLIFDYMPRELRPLDWRSQIETPGALAVHIMRNLEWYLLPPARVRLFQPGEWLRRYGASLFFLAVALMMLLAGILMGETDSVLLGQTQFRDSTGFVGAVAFFLVALIAFGLEFQELGVSYDARCAEFFRYLLDAYSDKREEAVPDDLTGHGIRK